MADISKITLPTGTTYDIKDQGARDLIAEMSGYTDFLGVTTTALTDGATTNPIKINNVDVTAKKGNIVTYGSAEFIFNGTAWQAFGDLSGLGSLAYKNSASGTVAVPKTYTTTVTPVAKNVSVSGTTTGSVSVTKSTVTVSKATSGTATYTPAGTVSTPTITVTPSTTTKYVASSATGGGSVTAGTAASFTATVSGETLSLGWSANTPTAVTLPSFSSQTIATGISSATSSRPSFTGTGARLVTDSQVATDASFTGASMTSTGSYTPATPTVTTTTATTENKTVTVS